MTEREMLDAKFESVFKDLKIFEMLIKKLENNDNSKNVKAFLQRKALDSINDNRDWLLMCNDEYIAIWQPKDEYSENIKNFDSMSIFSAEYDGFHEYVNSAKYNLIYIDKDFTRVKSDIVKRYNDNHVDGFLGHKIGVGDVITICSMGGGTNDCYKHFYISKKLGFVKLNCFRNDFDY